MVDLIRADDADVAFHTVDQDQRRAGAQTLQATHIERGILLKIGSRSLQRHQTVTLTKNRVADVLGRAFVDIPAGNDRDSCRGLRTGEVLVGAYLDDLVNKVDAGAVLLCRCRQADACEQ